MSSISIVSRNCVSRYLLNRFVCSASLLNSLKNKYFHRANLCFSSFLTTICIIRWFIGNQILYVDGCFNEFPLLQFILKKILQNDNKNNYKKLSGQDKLMITLCTVTLKKHYLPEISAKNRRGYLLLWPHPTTGSLSKSAKTPKQFYL